jgi:geranylgeranyl diphosphate synthase type II
LTGTLGDDRARLLALFEGALEAHLSALVDWPATLVESCRYALGTGGKRVRPLLCLMAAEAAGGDARAALPIALGLELVHTYSLVHDDLPSMDDDDMRRGQPTCHIRFGEAHAILTGDALLTEAFAVVGASGRADLCVLLAQAAGGAGMVAGQVLDIAPGPVASRAALEDLHRRKTGALLRCSALGGAQAVGASAEAAAHLTRYGEAVGLLFQLIDDLLDATQDAEAGNRSYLDHLPADAVRGLAAQVAAEATEAAHALGDRGATLAAFAEELLHRTV